MAIDRFKSTYVQAPKKTGFTFGKCLMYKTGVGYAFWDTSDANNKELFNGIIFDIDGDRVFGAMSGTFPISLADGTYYCNATGDLVTSLPMGSFTHVVGFVYNGLFHINSNIVPPSVVVGSVAWGDITGDINNQTDLIELINSQNETANFTHCC